MMGNPHEASGGPSDRSGGGGGGGDGRGQKATFSGMTVLVGVVAFILDVVSVAVPQWGNYYPAGIEYLSSGRSSQDSTGTFGPFQSCKQASHYSFCGGNTLFQPTVMLVAAGVCAILSVICLCLFCGFSILHVAMQLQRREIVLKYNKAVLAKLITASIAVVCTVGAVIMGAVHFAVGGGNTGLAYDTGVCYYLQIVLVFINLFLVVMSYISYRKARRHPLPMVPKSSGSGAHYE